MTPVPSRVGRPSSTPTGSRVTWRTVPVRRSQAWSWYEPLSVDATTSRSGSSAAQEGKDRRGARKRRSQAGTSDMAGRYRARLSARLRLRGAEHEGRVEPAKPERRRQHVIEPALAAIA